jgi:hypothetical protein
MKELKKHLASVNLTLALIVAGLLAWRGVDPCSHLFEALTGVGVEDMEIVEPNRPQTGPPSPGAVVIQLQDGQQVKIMGNGAIMVEGKDETDN